MYGSCPTAISVNSASGSLVSVHADQQVSSARGPSTPPPPPHSSGFCNGWFCADPGVLPEAEGVHRVVPEAAETRTAPQVAAEGHARHCRHLQPQQPGPAGSERHLHVRHHRPDPGTAPLRWPPPSESRGLNLSVN